MRGYGAPRVFTFRFPRGPHVCKLARAGTADPTDSQVSTYQCGEKWTTLRRAAAAGRGDNVVDKQPSPPLGPKRGRAELA